MRIKTIVDEDFTNYKKVSMFIGTVSCGGKCCLEAGVPLSICHNEKWNSAPTVDFSNEDIFARYEKNPMTSAVVVGGLEPFEQFDELKSLVEFFRINKQCNDDIVIYTGYREGEIYREVCQLEVFSNIYIKFGRFIPNQTPRYDSTLGVKLSSNNQYGKNISRPF